MVTDRRTIRWGARRSVLMGVSGVLSVVCLSCPVSGQAGDGGDRGPIVEVQVDLDAIRRATQSLDGIRPSGQPDESLASIEDALAHSTLPERQRKALLDACRRLNDDAWSVREEAARELLELRVSNDVLRQLIYVRAISPEQRHQLISVLAERILTAEAGAIGIRMNTLVTSGVLVDAVFEDMPAGKILKPGDMITHINEDRVIAPGQFTDLMKAYRPGDTISLTVRRPKEGANVNPALVARRPGELDPDLFTTFTTKVTLAPAERLGRDHMENLIARRQADVRLLLDNAPAPARRVLHLPDHRENVDEHPSIVALKRQVEILDRLTPGEKRTLVEHWQKTYDELARWTFEAGISDDERNYRRNVLNRFLELLPTQVFRGD